MWVDVVTIRDLAAWSIANHGVAIGGGHVGLGIENSVVIRGRITRIANDEPTLAVMRTEVGQDAVFSAVAGVAAFVVAQQSHVLHVNAWRQTEWSRFSHSCSAYIPTSTDAPRCCAHYPNVHTKRFMRMFYHVWYRQSLLQPTVITPLIDLLFSASIVSLARS